MRTYTTHDRRQSGSALLVAVMMLVLMGMIGLSALDTTTKDRQIAGVQNRARTAFYAAEAGVSAAKEITRTTDPDVDPTPALPATSLGSTSLYPYGQPSYTGDPDPAFPDPISFVQSPPRPWDNGGKMNMGGQRFVHMFWQINVQGQTADGSASRVEAVKSQLGAENCGGC